LLFVLLVAPLVTYVTVATTHRWRRYEWIRVAALVGAATVAYLLAVRLLMEQGSRGDGDGDDDDDDRRGDTRSNNNNDRGDAAVACDACA
jgi:hypothetical protein